MPSQWWLDHDHWSLTIRPFHKSNFGNSYCTKLILGPWANRNKCQKMHSIWARQIWPRGVSHKRSCKMQFRYVDLRSIGSPSQKLGPNLILPDLGWGPSSNIFGKNGFSDISFYWPQNQKINFVQYEFPKKAFLWNTLLAIDHKCEPGIAPVVDKRHWRQAPRPPQLQSAQETANPYKNKSTQEKTT